MNIIRHLTIEQPKQPALLPNICGEGTMMTPLGSRQREREKPLSSPDYPVPMHARTRQICRRDGVNQRHPVGIKGPAKPQREAEWGGGVDPGCVEEASL